MLEQRIHIKITQVSSATLVRDKVFYFNYVNEFSVNESYDKLTKTAKVVLPRNLKYSDENIYAGENPMIRRGDKIEIKSGYAPNLTTDFTGYVSRVDSQIPVTISCEDEMYLLKQKVCPKFTGDTTLKNLLSTINIGDIVPYESIDATLGKVRINQATYAFVLQTLYNEFGIYSHFKDGVLKVGLATDGTGVEKIFIFEEQVVDNNMDYLRSDDVNVRVKGVLIKKDNTKLEKFYGDEEGSLITQFVYGGTESELDRRCNDVLTNNTYTGYHGSFTTFLEPKVFHGDKCILKSYKQPERNGMYLIKSVVKSGGVKGGRQEIVLDRKL